MPSSTTIVGVVFGGASQEHNVSIKSASTVLNALQSGRNSTKFTVIPIYIDLEGRWWSGKIAYKVLKKGKSLSLNLSYRLFF